MFIISYAREHYLFELMSDNESYLCSFSHKSFVTTKQYLNKQSFY
jgi:hypothetical protein